MPQLTCMSGEVAISIRTAFWRIAGWGLLPFGCALPAQMARSSDALVDASESVGVPQ